MIKVFKGKLDVLLNWIEISLSDNKLKFSEKVELELLRADTIKAKELRKVFIENQVNWSLVKEC